MKIIDTTNFKLEINIEFPTIGYCHLKRCKYKLPFNRCRALWGDKEGFPDDSRCVENEKWRDCDEI